ncbi:MAG: hypothetical protein LWX56_01290 [Ignavibacteria bacterium]|nr:hypothetical protein [Ignavibacteria bacterium]
MKSAKKGAVKDVPILITRVNDDTITKIADTYTLSSNDVGGGAKQFVIYGNVITLPPSLTVPGVNITIHSRIIRTEGDAILDTSAANVQELAIKASNGAPATMSGQKGGDGDNGKDGEPGKKGGAILLMADQLELAGVLTLQSHGSKGGNGQDGGDGADGAPGAESEGNAGGDGGDGGSPGTGGFGAPGGDAGAILVRYVKDFSNTKIKILNNPGNSGTDGKNGSPGKGGKGGKGGTKTVYESKAWGGHMVLVSTNVKQPDGRDGRKGSTCPIIRRGKSSKIARTAAEQLTEMGYRRNILPLKYDSMLMSVNMAFNPVVDKLWWDPNHYYFRFPYLFPDKRFVPDAEFLTFMLHRVKLKYLAAKDENDFQDLHNALRWLYMLSDYDYILNMSKRYLELSKKNRAELKKFLDNHWINRGSRKKVAQESFDRMLNMLRRDNTNDTVKKLEDDYRKQRQAEINFAKQLEKFDMFEKELYELIKMYDSSAMTLVHSATGTLLAQLASGLDYYGNPWNYVPIVNFNTLQSQYNILVNAGESLEQLLSDYENKDAQQEITLNRLKEAVSAHKKIITTRDKESKQFITDKKAIETEIEKVLIPPVREKESKLRKDSEEFLKSLQEKLVLDSLVSAVKVGASIYTMATTGSAGLTIGYAALSALTGAGGVRGDQSTHDDSKSRAEKKKIIEIEMEDFSKRRAEKDKDQPAKKDEKPKDVEKEKKKEEQEKTLSDAWDELKNTYSSGVEVYDEGKKIYDNVRTILAAQDTYGVNSNMLMMTEEQFDKMLEPVYDKVKDKADVYRKAFKDYRAAVRLVQDKVLIYRGLQTKYHAALNDMGSSEQKISKLQTIIAEKIDPTLSSVHQIVKEMYEEIKMKLLDYLYQEHLALRYLTLDDSPFEFTIDSKIAFLEDSHAELSAKFLEFVQKVNAYPQEIMLEFEYSKTSHPDILDQLRETGQTNLPVSLDIKEVKKGLAGTAHYVAERIELVLHQVKTADETLHIGITHPGSAVFIDRSGQSHVYAHHSMDIINHYSYRMIEGEYVVDDKKRGGGNLRDKHHILLSPLTNWSIYLPATDGQNQGLDFTRFDKINVKIIGKGSASARKKA